jgi:hypothetical protein
MAQVWGVERGLHRPLRSLAWALRGVTQGGGTTTTVPVKPGNRPLPGVGSYVRWDPAEAPALFRALREDEPVRTPRTR